MYDVHEKIKSIEKNIEFLQFTIKELYKQNVCLSSKIKELENEKSGDTKENGRNRNKSR